MRKYRRNWLFMAVVLVGVLLVSCQPAVEKQTEALPEDSCELPQRLPKEDKATDPTKNDVMLNATIPLIDASASTKTETATFALGWFWGPDSRFGSISGVVHTRVGYAGGTTKNPTYHRLGDHSETIQIDYDPTQVSYEKLLDIFWDSHDPTRQSWSRQYMSIIFYHNEEQKGLAIETKDREEATKGKISTEVIPASEFYLAEPYHQKYRLQQVPDLIKDFSVIYPALDDFINSTAAARVNGYVGGYGTLATLEEEINSLGLSPTAEEKLREIAKRNQ